MRVVEATSTPQWELFGTLLDEGCWESQKAKINIHSFRSLLLDSLGFCGLILPFSDGDVPPTCSTLCSRSLVEVSPETSTQTNELRDMRIERKKLT